VACETGHIEPAQDRHSLLCEGPHHQLRLLLQQECVLPPGPQGSEKSDHTVPKLQGLLSQYHTVPFFKIFYQYLPLSQKLTKKLYRYRQFFVSQLYSCR